MDSEAHGLYLRLCCMAHFLIDWGNYYINPEALVLLLPPQPPSINHYPIASGCIATSTELTPSQSRTGGQAGSLKSGVECAPSYRIPWRIQSHWKGSAAEVAIPRQQRENVLLHSLLIVFLQMGDMANG